MRQIQIRPLITNRSSASLHQYLADISKLEMVSPEEEVILANKIQQGDREALEKLTTANLRFVVSVAKQFQNQGISLSDLINEGNIGLIKAAARFDEKRGFKFISYAVWWIRQSILQAINEQSRLIRLPVNRISALNKIQKSQALLEQKLGRQASIAELALTTEFTEEEISLTLKSSVTHHSTDATFPGNENSSLSDILFDPENPLPDDLLMSTSLSIEIKRTLSKLSERESQVILLYYGIGFQHPFTLQEIATKYDLTKERVRQIKKTALQKLQRSSRSGTLKTYLG